MICLLDHIETHRALFYKINKFRIELEKRTFGSRESTLKIQLTLIYSETKIAFPFLAVHKIYKWIDIRST